MKSMRLSLRLLAAFTSLLALAFAATAQTETILHDFVAAPFGINPTAPLITDSAGNLYGVTSTGGVENAGVVFELVRGSNGRWSQKILHIFRGSPDGASPMGRLIFDRAGNLYGTTELGGAYNSGTIYRLTPSAIGSWNESILYSFGGTRTDAVYPQWGLALDQAGNLYGVTAYGGTSYWGGTVYRLSPSVHGNWSEQIIYEFTEGATGGSAPLYELGLDSAGNLYGVAGNGGDINCNTWRNWGEGGGCGTIFELSPSSSGWWNETVLYAFVSPGYYYDQYWWGASGRLSMSSSGDIFGATVDEIFELHPTEQGTWVFKYVPSSRPGSAAIVGSIVLDAAGNIYGESPDLVFELQQEGTEWTTTILYAFPPNSRLYLPGTITLDASGNIFGTTSPSLNKDFGGSVFELTPSSQRSWKLSWLYNFPSVDGNYPVGDLISDAVGNLYGVTEDGGANSSVVSYLPAGVVFRLSPQKTGSWKYDILYDFSLNASTGGPLGPWAGLVFDSSGNLYGTTSGGGTTGGGTVFELSPTAAGYWKETTLYTFGAFEGDGYWPICKLVFDANGNLYGTTFKSNSRTGDGTVFELSPQSDGTWLEKQLYTFTGGSDGGQPRAGLVLDNLGNLYGTAWTGGGTGGVCLGAGCGTVFKLSPNSNGIWTETVLYTFSTLAAGENPSASLIFDSAGNLYGGTSSAVFKLTPSNSGTWSESTLYSFQGGTSDGSGPVSDLAFDAAGNLYGTTPYGGLTNFGGNLGSGILFKLTPTLSGQWTETIVHFFGSGKSDGSFPQSGVLIDSSGNLFGMTSYGPGTLQAPGPYGGAVFKITE
jgi:uncharacterized repeat protein (TIGR03803 family)